MATQTLVLQILSKGFGVLNKDLTGLEKSFQRSMSKIARVSSQANMAVMAMSSGTSGLDNQVLKATTGIVGMASAMAAGGPLGIAMGSATLAMMAIVKVYNTATFETKMLEGAQRSLAGAFAKTRDRLNGQRQSVEDLEKQVQNYGKTSASVTIEETQARVNSRFGILEQVRIEQQRARALVTRQELAVRAASDLAAADEGASQAGLNAMQVERQKLDIARADLATISQTLANAEMAQDHDRRTIDATRTLAGLKQREENDEAKRDGAKQRRRDAAKKDRDLERQHMLGMIELQRAVEEEKERRSKFARDMATQDRVYQLDREIAAIEMANARKLAIDTKQLEGERAAAAERARFHEQAMRGVESIAVSTAGTIGSSMAALVMGTQTAAEAVRNGAASMLEAVVDAAINMVTAYAASSAGAAFFSQAGIPIVGPILATAAAATAGAFVRALIGQIRTAAYGYPAAGQNVGGRDTQLVMMDPRRERIVPEGPAQQMGGGGVPINVYVTASPDAGNRAATERYFISNMVPSIRRAWEQGHLDFLRSAA